MEADKSFLYKELSYKLVGCFLEIYNKIGPAHKEQLYHEAIKISFDRIAIVYQSKPNIHMKFQGRSIGVYEPDFIIENKIILEIKSVLTMPSTFERQLFYYLRSTSYKVGYLVNFGSDKIDIRRRIFDSVRKRK